MPYVTGMIIKKGYLKLELILRTAILRKNEFMKKTLLIILGVLGILGFFYWMKKNHQKSQVPRITEFVGMHDLTDKDAILSEDPEPESFPAYLWGDNAAVVLSISPDNTEILQGDLIIINNGECESYKDPIEVKVKIKGVYPSVTDARESYNLFTNTKYDRTFGDGDVMIQKVS